MRKEVKISLAAGGILAAGLAAFLITRNHGTDHSNEVAFTDPNPAATDVRNDGVTPVQPKSDAPHTDGAHNDAHAGDGPRGGNDNAHPGPSDPHPDSPPIDPNSHPGGSNGGADPDNGSITTNRRVDIADFLAHGPQNLPASMTDTTSSGDPSSSGPQSPGGGPTSSGPTPGSPGSNGGPTDGGNRDTSPGGIVSTDPLPSAGPFADNDAPGAVPIRQQHSSGGVVPDRIPNGGPISADSASTRPSPRTHTVQTGETFSSIAKLVYGNAKYYSRIVAANPTLNPSRLRPGTIINLPDLSSAPVSSNDAPAHPQPDPKNEKPIDPKTTYRVVAGDTLERIALKLYNNHAIQDDLYDLNKPLIGADRNRLVIGWLLRLPIPPTTHQ